MPRTINSPAKAFAIQSIAIQASVISRIVRRPDGLLFGSFHTVLVSLHVKAGDALAAI